MAERVFVFSMRGVGDSIKKTLILMIVSRLVNLYEFPESVSNALLEITSRPVIDELRQRAEQRLTGNAKAR